jgi:hypothetical protein
VRYFGHTTLILYSSRTATGRRGDPVPLLIFIRKPDKGEPLADQLVKVAQVHDVGNAPLRADGMTRIDLVSWEGCVQTTVF